MKAPDTGPGLVEIRSEAPSDAAAIEAVTIAAFSDVVHSGHTEQFIVRELRKAGALTFQGALPAGEVSYHPAFEAVA